MKKIGMILASVGLVAVFTAFMFTNTELDNAKSSQIGDVIQVADYASTQSNPTIVDFVEFEDSINVENAGVLDYYVDENGVKHFLIQVSDMPTLG